jgi:hypothetical protein
VATELYKARIYNNVIGYKGKIDIWDVVNEPVNTVPWEMAIKDTANDDGFRYSVKGIDIDQIAPWVEKSFKWAYEANPDGNYILNEFFTLAIPEVRDRFYRLLKELRNRNTPIKGIGIQAHEPRDMWFSPVEMYKTFDMYKEFNLPIHITEFIPQSGGKDIDGCTTFNGHASHIALVFDQYGSGTVSCCGDSTDYSGSSAACYYHIEFASRKFFCFFVVKSRFICYFGVAPQCYFSCNKPKSKSSTGFVKVSSVHTGWFIDLYIVKCKETFFSEKYHRIPE